MLTTFEHYQNIINKALSSHTLLSSKTPSTLHEAMLYSLSAPGKRLRPILFLLSAKLFGVKTDTILPIAIGIEMIHTYSLIHDDLPAIDNDTMRRGKKTNHVVFGEDIALLAGDALLTEGFSQIFSAKLSAKKICSMAKALSNAIGSFGIIGGQVLDIQNKGNVTLKEILTIHEMKTASLISSCCEMGALSGTNNMYKIKLLSEYGKNLGYAFQIVDDILDKIGTAEKIGKSIGKDILLGKKTYPDIVGIEKAQEDAIKYSKNAEKCLTSLDFSSTIRAEKEAFNLLKNITKYIIKELS